MAAKPFILRFLVPEDYANIPVLSDIAKGLHMILPSLFPPGLLKNLNLIFIIFCVVFLVSLVVHTILDKYYGDYEQYFK